MKALFDYTVNGLDFFYSGEDKEINFYPNPDYPGDIIDSARDAARSKVARDGMFAPTSVNIKNIRIV